MTMKTIFFNFRKILIYILACIAVVATALFTMTLTPTTVSAATEIIENGIIFNTEYSDAGVDIDAYFQIGQENHDLIKAGKQGTDSGSTYKYTYYELIAIRTDSIECYNSTLPLDRDYKKEWNTEGSGYIEDCLINNYNVTYARFSLHNDYSESNSFTYNGYSGVLNKGLKYINLFPNTKLDKTYYYYFIVQEITNEYYIGQSSAALSGVGAYDRTYATLVCKSDYVELNLYQNLMSELTGEKSSNDYNLTAIQKEMGIYNETGVANIAVNYIKMKGADGAGTSYADYEEVQDVKVVPSIYLQNKNKVMELILNSYGAEGLSYFNANYYEYAYDASVENYVKLQEKVVREAIDFTYEYSNQQFFGTITIVYTDYRYQDLSLRITNNDSTNLLTLDVFTTNVTESNGTTTLTWSYSSIESELYNRCKWLFELTGDNVSFAGAKDGVNVNVNALLGDNEYGLTVTFSEEADLFGLNLVAVANIVPDKNYTVTYSYKEIDDNLVVTEKTSAPFTMLMSEFKKLYEAEELFATRYPEAINVIIAAISPAILNGEPYYTYNTITLSDDYDTAVGVIVVNYTVNALIRASDNIGSVVTYRAINGNSAFYKPGDLYYTLPAGYRCESVSYGDGIRLQSFDLQNWNKTVIDTSMVTNEQRNSGAIIDVTFNLSDKWYVVINYLERYKNTCFAIKKGFQGEVRVLDYGYNLETLTMNKIAQILNKDNLNILKSLATARTVVFDNKITYTITVQYSEASMIQIDYDGNRKELKIPITSFYDWKILNNLDYSIGGLNTEDVTYFPYTTLEQGMTQEESEKILYGYFASAVFEERNVDLNHYFRNTTGDGCAVINKSKEIKGSAFYKFLNSGASKFAFSAGGALVGGVTGALVGIGLNYGLLAFCEVTDSDNCILYSYFFYLDCTSEKAFISNGGADDAYDDDSAMGNAGQDLLDTVKDWGINIGNWFVEKVWGWLKWVLLGVAVIVILAFAIKLILKIK